MHGMIILVSPKQDDQMVKNAMGDRADYVAWEGRNQAEDGNTRWGDTFAAFIKPSGLAGLSTITNRFSPLLENFDMDAALAHKYTEHVVIDHELSSREGWCIVRKAWEQNPTFVDDTLENLALFKEYYEAEKTQATDGPLRVFLYDYHY